MLFLIILSLQGIRSFLNILIAQGQQYICLCTSKLAALHPILTGSPFVSGLFASQSTTIIQPVIFRKVLNPLTIGVYRFPETLQVV